MALLRDAQFPDRFASAGDDRREERRHDRRAEGEDGDSRERVARGEEDHCACHRTDGDARRGEHSGLSHEEGDDQAAGGAERAAAAVILATHHHEAVEEDGLEGSCERE